MWRALIVLLVIASPAWAWQPAESVLAAYRDVRTLPPEERACTRYLACVPDDPMMTRIQYLVAAGHVNFLSQRRRIVPPLAVLADGSTFRWPNIEGVDWTQLRLIRLRITDYGWDPKVWERLGDPALEPLFHANSSQHFPAGKYANGAPYAEGFYKVPVLAPWLLSPLGLAKPEDAKEYADAVIGLSVETGYSQTPIVEVSNFVWQAAQSFDRKSGYYDWLGIKDLRTFQRLVGFDEKATLAFASPLLEAVSNSGVSVQARRVEIFEKIGGRYFVTKDQVNQRGIGNRNPLTTLGRNDLKFDAQEIFASLPNGLWATGLFSDKGERQDSAPDGVGFFHGTRSNDGRISIFKSCIQCHDARPGNGGLQPLQPFFRSLYSSLALGSDKIKVLKDLEDEYLTKIDVKADQQRYVDALFEACGLAPHEFARHLGEIDHLWDRPVNRERAARLFGVTEGELVKMLGVQMKTYGFLDNTLANFLLPDSLRMSVGVDQFSEAYATGQLTIRNLPVWPASLKGRAFPKPK